MPRDRPLLFTAKYREKSFRKHHWYVSGFVGGKRVQLWFKSEKDAKAAAASRNSEIKTHGTQISLSPVDRIQAVAAAEKLAPYGKTIAEAVDFFVAHLDRLNSSISVHELCDRVSQEFARRLTAGEISVEHFSTMKETSKRFAERFGDQPIKMLPGMKIVAPKCPSPFVCSHSVAIKEFEWTSEQADHSIAILRRDPVTPTP